METSELLKKVRTIEIKTRGLSKHIFAGEYHSAFKGRGMAFSEVREYQYGDDVRSIDWNVTARFNHPYVKIFEEERELTVMLIVDVSGSRMFGSNVQLKKELITEISAVLSFSAIQNNDKVGIILFSDKIEKFIPPKKGKSHILRIIRELIDFTPESSGTDIAGAIKYFSNVVKKRSTCFLISDFIAADFTKEMRIANYRHDMIALQVLDDREIDLPPVGIINMRDAETGETYKFDTLSKRNRNNFSKITKKRIADIQENFSKTGVDYATLKTGYDYIPPLLKLFKMR